MRTLLVLCVLACSACSDADAGDAPQAGASERDACDAVAQCIFGVVDDDAAVFSDQCVADGIFAPAPAVCRACLIDLSCANLEAAFEGDTDAQAMCPSCE